MPKKSPSQVIPSWAVNGTIVSFDLNDFSAVGVTAAEVHPTSGDYGIFLRGLMEHNCSYYQSLAEDSKPLRWSIEKGTPFAILVPNAANPQRVPFQVNVDIAAPLNAYELISE